MPSSHQKKFAASLFLLLAFLFTTHLAAAASLPYQFVKVQNRQLLVDFDRDGNYTPFIIKGVGYSPTPVGRYSDDWGYPSSLDPRPKNLYDDPVVLNRDFSLLQQMNANVVRFWKGNNTQVTFADTQNPQSQWYLHYADIGRFPNFLTTQTFDVAQSYNIKIIAGFEMPSAGYWQCNQGISQYVYTVNFNNTNVRNDIITRFRSYVLGLKDNPALLFWAIGNENNLNFNDSNPEGRAQIQAYYSLVQTMAQEARLIEGSFYHPVAIVNGDLSTIGRSDLRSTDADLSYIDIWGSNVYRGATFGNLFQSFAALSNKALWISEFGEDAWHSNDVLRPENGYEDQATQANVDGALWSEIKTAYLNQKSIGGTIMAYSDEWWKPWAWLCEVDNDPATTANGPGGCNLTQNYYGYGPQDQSCPLDGTIEWTPPAADHFFNEEWWGIMAINKDSRPGYPDVMNPRQVYTTLQQLFFEPINPDFIVTAISAPSNVSLGDSFIANMTVKNIGSVNGRSMTTSYYLSTDNQITTSDVLVGTSTIPALDPGASYTDTPLLTMPGSLTGTQYYIGAIADGPNTVTESNENNNALAGNIITLNAAADLIATNLTGPTSAKVGSAVTLNDRVKNQGGGAANNFNVAYYLSTDPIITSSDIRIESRFISYLPGWSYFNNETDFNLPANLPAGTYYWGMIVDDTNTCNESNENNNATTGNTVVITSSLPTADLTATALTGPTSATVGTVVTLNDRVKNQGTGTATNFDVAYYLSSDPIITTTDIRIGNLFIGYLPASTYYNDENSFNLPSNLPAGTYYWGMIVDDTNSCSESNENNNAATGNTIIITSSTPAAAADLTATALSGPTTASAGSSVTLNDRVKNQGAVIGTNFYVGYYLSTDPIITTSDIRVENRFIFYLPAFSYYNNETSFNLPANLPAGTYYWGIIVDNTNTCTESDENNNSFAGNVITITPQTAIQTLPRKQIMRTNKIKV